MHAIEQDTETLRAMTPAEKLAVMRALIRQAWELKAAAIRARQPDLPESEASSSGDGSSAPLQRGAGSASPSDGISFPARVEDLDTNVLRFGSDSRPEVPCGGDQSSDV